MTDFQKGKRSMSVLVIGATGDVGSALTEQLTAQGVEVRAGTRSPESYSGPAGATPVLFEWGDPTTWPKAVAGCWGVFMINTGPALENLPEFIRLAHNVGVRRGVLMTALGVEYLPDTVPVRQVEHALMGSGMLWGIVRPTWFMQNFSTGYIRPQVNAGMIRLPAGDGATSFVDTRDIAAVAAAVLTREELGGAAYGITGGEALRHDEVAAVLSKVTGRTIGYESVDDETFVREMVSGGTPAEEAVLVGGLYTAVKAGMAARVLPTVEEITGRAPISFEQFAMDSAACWE
jgi:uncharacterized protein YbjT (DUF2867 family)